VRRGNGRGAQEERVDVLTGDGKKGDTLNLGRRRRLDSAAWFGGAEARHGWRWWVRARAASGSAAFKGTEPWPALRGTHAQAKPGGGDDHRRGLGL
jgi:hypothetical protein